MIAQIQVTKRDKTKENLDLNKFHRLRSERPVLRQAAQAGAELVVLPEYFCLLGRRDTDLIAQARIEIGRRFAPGRSGRMGG
jgi:predicted amidohydrolase